MLRIIAVFFMICLNIYSYEYFEIGNFYNQKKEDLIKPVGVKLDNNGNKYIADFVGGKIVCYNIENILKYIIKVDYPTYISIIKDKIYVTVSNKHKIIIFNKETGEKISEFGSYGMKQGEFKNPGAIYEFNNNVFIVDELNFRIEVFDYNNRFIKEILLPKNKYIVKGPYSLNYFLVFINNKMYVLDKYSKKIYEYYGDFRTRSEDYINVSFVSSPSYFFCFNDNFFIFDNIKNSLYVLDNKLKFKEELKISVEKEIDVLFPLAYENVENIFHFINNGDYYTYDLKTNEVKKTIDNYSIKEWEFVEPIELRKNSQNNILILDKKLEKIVIFSQDGKYLNTIKNIGKNPTGFYLDEFDNIYVALAGENKVKKLDKIGELIYSFGDYSIFSTSFSYYYENLTDEEKEKRADLKELYKADAGKIYNLKIVVDKKGYIYVLDSKNGKVKVFDQFFRYQYEFGQKANFIDIILNKKRKDKFGWDEQDEEGLKSMDTDGENIYIVDNIYKKIDVYKKGNLIKTIDDGFKGKISSVTCQNGVISLTDTDNFNVIKYSSKDYKRIETISFLNDGLMPIWYDGEYIIAKESKLNYILEYKIYDLKGKKNDRDKKLEGNIERKKNNR